MKFNIKYGIKSIFRTPLKTVLFFLLLTTATVFLSLGIGIWRSAENMLAEADSVFKTAGEFIYTGGNYPGNSQYDPYLDAASDSFYATDALTRPEVLMAEESMTHRAVAEGYMPDRNKMPYIEYAVMILSANPVEAGAEWDQKLSMVLDVPYTAMDAGFAFVILSPGEDAPADFVLRSKYAVFGRLFSVAGNMYRGFRPMPFDSIGIYDAPYPPVVELAGRNTIEAIEAFMASDEGAFFGQVIDRLDSANRSVNVVVTEDVTAVSQFHTGEYVITDGGYFAPGDANSCIIPKRVAGQMELSVGDSLSLSIQYPTGETGLYGGYDIGKGYASTETYTVAGIYLSEENEETIYIPYAAQPWAGRSKADYCLARVVLDNRTAASYIDTVTPELPPGVTFNHSDQGYAGAVRPILAMREAALTVTAVCAAVFLSLLWFFGFFFIFRSRESARVLSTLGTKAGGIISHFLAGSCLIALVSASIGSLVGYAASGRIADSVYAALTVSRDIRFSIESYGIRFEDFSATAETTPGPFALTALAVFAAATVATAIFAFFRVSSQNPSRIFRKRMKKDRYIRDDSRKGTHDTPPGGSPNTPPGGQRMKRGAAATNAPHVGPRMKRAAATRLALPSSALRYAVRSTLRSGKRGLAVPALFAVLLSFLSIFTGMRDSYRDRLERVYDDIPVSARFTDRYGNRYDNLYIDEEQFSLLSDAGYIDEMWRSANLLIRYEYAIDKVDWNDPVSAFWTVPDIPRGVFAYDTFIGQLRTFSSPLTVTNDFAHSPEFNFTGPPDVVFADGFGWESFYSQLETDAALSRLIESSQFDFLYQLMGVRMFSEGAPPDIIETRDGNPDFVIASSEFLEEHGLALGDTAVLSIFSGDLFVAVKHPFVIGGVFDSDSGRSSVFLPEVKSFETSYHGSSASSGSRRLSSSNIVEVVRFHAGGVLLKNTRELSALKDVLEQQYEPLGAFGSLRRWIIIDDKALYDTIDALSRHITYMDIASPVIFALVALIGFVVSNLLLKSRTSEIGLLRGVGTAQPAIFTSLFVEQVLLSIPGFLIGLLVPAAAGVGVYDPRSAGIFTICYFAGAAAAIAHTQRSKAIKSVGRPDE